MTQRAASSPTPSLTPRPTKTRQSTPTLDVPQETAAVLSTMDALVTQDPGLGEFYSWHCMLLHNCHTTWLGLSPDGQWAVFLSLNDLRSYGLKIASVDGTKQWAVYTSDLMGSDSFGSESFVSARYWSPEGKYLYLVPEPNGDGGYYWFWGGYEKLIRLDLETGQWLDTGMGRASSFSPDGRYIAYRSDHDVHVYEFKTGQERVFPVSSEFTDVGRFSWSPDSNKIIFVAAKEELDINQTGFTLSIIDLTDNTIRVILEDDLRFLYPYSWQDADRVILNSFFEKSKYQLDLKTNEITPVE